MKVVAKKYFLGLLPSTVSINETIFTSTEGGDFLVSAALAGNIGNLQGEVSVSLSWTDALGNVQEIPINYGIGSVGTSGPANIPAGGFVTLLVSNLPNSDTVPFNLYVIVADLAAPGL